MRETKLTKRKLIKILYHLQNMDRWQDVPESQLASLAVYTVNDTPVPEHCSDRSLLSLPKNLTLKGNMVDGINNLTVWATDIIPRGTR